MLNWNWNWNGFYFINALYLQEELKIMRLSRVLMIEDELDAREEELTRLLNVKKSLKVRWTVDHKSALLWQKEANLQNEISRKWAKCVCYVDWLQCNIISFWLQYISAGWVFLLKTQTGSRKCSVQSKNINISDLDDLSLASFCQSRAAFSKLLPGEFHNQRISVCQFEPEK